MNAKTAARPSEPSDEAVAMAPADATVPADAVPSTVTAEVVTPPAPGAREDVVATIARHTPTRAGAPDGPAVPDGTYSRDEAAEVLGVTTRRVSQLASQGQLDIVQAKPLIVTAKSVDDRRVSFRRATDRPTPIASEPVEAVSDDVATQVERIVALFTEETQKRLEAEARLLVEVTKQRDHLKAEVGRLRAELDDARLALSEAPVAQTRGWRKPGK